MLSMMISNEDTTIIPRLTFPLPPPRSMCYSIIYVWILWDCEEGTGPGRSGSDRATLTDLKGFRILKFFCNDWVFIISRCDYFLHSIWKFVSLSFFYGYYMRQFGLAHFLYREEMQYSIFYKEMIFCHSQFECMSLTGRHRSDERGEKREGRKKGCGRETRISLWLGR